MPAILLVLEQILFKLLGFDTDIRHPVLHSLTGNVSVASQVVPVASSTARSGT